MTAPAMQTIQNLPGFRKVGENQYEARCSGHEDHRASLSISMAEDGKILLHCHAGCSTDLVLQAMGLTAKDLFPKTNGNGHTRIVAVYDYTTPERELSYQVVRFEPKDFRQRRPDGNGGWIPDVKGLKRLPYNLSEVLKADFLFNVEGEKDVENLRKIGLTATCNSGGACKWTAELNQYFRSDQHVTIIPDNDKPGRDHAELVAKNLSGIVASVKILTLEGLPEKGDVTTWLKGRDPETAAEELCRLAEAAPEWQPEPTEPKQNDNPIATQVRELIENTEGVITTGQIYRDLSATSVQDKAAIRQTLTRLKGKKIQPEGSIAGQWRVIRGDAAAMDFDVAQPEPLDLWLPFDLHNYVEILPGNLIIVTGDADSGKTAFLLNIIKRNIDKWNCSYFNSEMGMEELRKRLLLFHDFPIRHPHFNAFERSSDFQDVIQPGRYSLNIIDYLEVTDDFFKVGGYLNQIHKVLNDAIAIVAIQKRNRNSPMPLGAERALEKPRLAISLSIGNKSTPNQATILKCKNRKTAHSMIGRSRAYKLVAGSEFRCDSPEWI